MKYSVEITRQVTDLLVALVYIEAPNDEEAQAIAQRQLDSGEITLHFSRQISAEPHEFEINPVHPGFGHL